MNGDLLTLVKDYMRERSIRQIRLSDLPAEFRDAISDPNSLLADMSYFDRLLTGLEVNGLTVMHIATTQAFMSTVGAKTEIGSVNDFERFRHLLMALLVELTMVGVSESGLFVIRWQDEQPAFSRALEAFMNPKKDVLASIGSVEVGLAPGHTISDVRALQPHLLGLLAKQGIRS